MNYLAKLMVTLALPVMFGAGCALEPEPRDYREAMRNLVIEISQYARSTRSGFVVIPQNGQELITLSGDPSGQVHEGYLEAIDGTGREDLFYGYVADDEPSPTDARDYLLNLCRIFRDQGKTVLVTDYVSSQDKVDDSYTQNSEEGFISFAADERGLYTIPGYPSEPHGRHNGSVATLDQAKNFLYLINDQAYSSKEALLDAIQGTDYDVVIMDLFTAEGALNATDLEGIRTKNQGGQRLIIAYMSIGEAEDYRYYWNPQWETNPPPWLYQENPNWEGNYKVAYWDPNWKDILFGSSSAYLDRILQAGFDGVYLDIIDGFEFFE